MPQPPHLVLLPPVPASDREATRVVPLADKARECAAGSVTADSTPAFARPFASRQRSQLRFAHQCGGNAVGRYFIREPEHGVSEITLAPPASQRPASGAPVSADGSNEAAAEEHFRMAERLLARGYTRAAVFEAQRGMKCGVPRPERRALYAWLLYQRGGGRAIHPRVWEHLERALATEPACAVAHYYAGLLFKRSGQIEDARAHFERVLALEPQDRHAQTELELLALQPSAR